MFCSNCGIQCSVDANFCHSCGRNLQEERDSLSRGENENDLGNIIADYFYRGYPCICDYCRAFEKNKV